MGKKSPNLFTVCTRKSNRCSEDRWIVLMSCRNENDEKMKKSHS
jgi:hypothetical protein